MKQFYNDLTNQWDDIKGNENFSAVECEKYLRKINVKIRNKPENEEFLEAEKIILKLLVNIFNLKYYILK